MAYLALAPPSSPDVTFNPMKELTNLKVHRVTNSNDGGIFPPPATCRFDQLMSKYGLPAAVLCSTPIHILNDDVLLNIFYLCKPQLLNEDEVDTAPILQGGEWIRERWWYKIAQVCRRWRYLILTSPSHLGLCLVCTYDTPVEDMLAHSPPLPIILDYVDDSRRVSTEDEEGILLALQHRDRVRRIRLHMPVQDLQRLIVAIHDEFPMLEYLFIEPLCRHRRGLILPQTFRAPHIRYLILSNFAFSIGSPLLTTPMDLVTLSLQNIHPYVYFHPNALLQRLPLMPLLETLQIAFHSLPTHDIQMQLLDTPITTHVTLPNLRWFAFGGTNTYLETLLPWMTTPLLERLQIKFVHQLTFSVPRLLQFMNTAENLRFGSAMLAFYNEFISMRVYPHKGARMYAFYLQVTCKQRAWQVASAAQLFNALRTVFSTVEDLTLEYWGSLEWHDEADRMRWHELLRPFSNVKSLHVDNGLVRVLSRFLQTDDGESPLELLPELKELSYIPMDDLCDIFTPFINARQNAGHPVTLIRYNFENFCGERRVRRAAAVEAWREATIFENIIVATLFS